MSLYSTCRSWLAGLSKIRRLPIARCPTAIAGISVGGAGLLVAGMPGWVGWATTTPSAQNELSTPSGVVTSPTWISQQSSPPPTPTPTPTPTPSPSPSPTPPLRLVPLDKLPSSVGFDDRLWGWAGQPGDRQALLTAIQNSLNYLQTPRASQAYQRYSQDVGAAMTTSTPFVGCTETLHERTQRSLTRFRQILLATKSPATVQVAVRREFAFYQSIGKDGRGRVGFTGYFEPIYAASRVPTATYRYPLFRLPPNLNQWPKPHPTRIELEGRDGLQSGQGALRGLELVWLRDRLEAFFAQIQGSARLRLTDGTVMTVGYAGRTDYPYTSIGKELIKDGKVPAEGLTLPIVLDYLKKHPTEVDEYLSRNQRFVFFRETNGSPAIGSLQIPVTAERSIATDKSLFPHGALAWIQTQIPYPVPTRQRRSTQQPPVLKQRAAGRFVLDQDTGGAIIGPGRVDIFMGTGELAGHQAGLIISPGQLYYLLLRNCPADKQQPK